MNLNNNHILNDKYLGSFLSSVIGDVLGWPQEQDSNNTYKSYKKNKDFQSWQRVAGSRFHKHIETMNAGEYSDDTQLTIATARSLLSEKEWYNNFVQVELPFWLNYERGGGTSTKKACKSWMKSVAPWKSKDSKFVHEYFHSGGNGAVMRIMPHVFQHSENKKLIARDVFKNALATHGHPKALVSSLVYAMSLNYLLHLNKRLEYGEIVDYLINNCLDWSSIPNLGKMDEWYEMARKVYGQSYSEVWKIEVDSIIGNLYQIKSELNKGLMSNTQKTLEEIGCFKSSINGSGSVTILSAIYIFSKYATSPQTAIMEAAFFKNADTDTLASIVGGLFGILYGTEWIPKEWSLIQDKEFITKITNGLFLNIDKKGVVYEPWTEKQKVKFVKTVKKSKLGDRIGLDFLGYLELNGIYKCESKVKNYEFTNYKYVTKDGQILYIKIISKIIGLDTKVKAEKIKLSVEDINFDFLDKIVLIAPDLSFKDGVELLKLLEKLNGKKLEEDMIVRKQIPLNNKQLLELEKNLSF